MVDDGHGNVRSNDVDTLILFAQYSMVVGIVMLLIALVLLAAPRRPSSGLRLVAEPMTVAGVITIGVSLGCFVVYAAEYTLIHA